MRALVTGANGFVGRYLVDALQRTGAEVLGCAGPRDDGGPWFPIDLSQAQTLSRALDAARPTVVFHLAAQTFVPDSLAAPIETYEINAIGSARLAEAVRAYDAGPRPRVVFASTAEVYGARDPSEFPLRESLDLHPANPYGASKAAAEAILLAHARSFGLNVVIARSFNHIGPAQSERFVVASLASQLARIAAGGSPQLFVGNLNAARDFLDVRDVVAAYRALIAHADSLPERLSFFNVGSGEPVAIGDLLEGLRALARRPFEIDLEPALFRPAALDLPSVALDAGRLKEAVGWRPVHSKQDMLGALMDYWRSVEAAKAL